jgi:MinD-like ATPase involved in chromosome partitioning or flagellar assembly
VLVACWSIKGGSGTTVVSAALTLVLARRAPGGAVLADLTGDGPAVLGLSEPRSPGLAGWLSAGDEVPADALARIEVRAGRGVGLLPRGTGPLSEARAGVLAAVLDGGARPVVVDAGSSPGPAALAVVAGAQRSILVIRPCYLALRRAQSLPLHPTEVVIVQDEGRALGRADVERTVAAPVVAEVPLDPAVARAVDAGLLARRLPRSLERSLRHAA